MNKTLLELKDISLSYNYAKKPLLQNMSLHASEWEILSIIGKNGTGKSSLLKIIVWIETWFSWKLKKYTQKLAYVPQKIHLEKSFPLAVEEFFAIFHDHISQTKLKQLLVLFSMQDFLSQNIHTLSWGEFQKILIINALLSEPELLVLDEPTTGIDAAWEEQFYQNINEIKQNFPKLAIIMVSHNLHLVYKNSSRIICLHENGVCCHGTPDELTNNPDITKIFGKHVTSFTHHNH